MPTAEGVFPKVGNDPIYYSEVNLIPRHIGSVYISGLTTSSSSYVNAGSSITIIPASGIKMVMAEFIGTMYHGNGGCSQLGVLEINGSEIPESKTIATYNGIAAAGVYTKAYFPILNGSAVAQFKMASSVAGSTGGIATAYLYLSDLPVY